MNFAGSNARSNQLNIVYLHTHDTGKFIGPYNQAFDTPSLNWLAERGTVLDNLFCVGPTCSPSRSGLLTGLYPHQSGMKGLAHRGFALHNMAQHLCRYLGSHGYETTLCGMQHESADASSIGYDHVYISNKKEADDLTAWDEEHAQAACRFIQSTHDKPFFLSYGLVQTHRPFLEMDDDFAEDQSLQVPDVLPDTPETKEDMARFMTSVRRADTCIGRVLKTLEEENLLDRTIIFYTTDHGAAFPFMKCTLSDYGIGVAGILAFPSNMKKGERLAGMLSHIDFFPTLCDLISIDKPNWLMGKSFAQLMTLTGNASDRDDSDNKNEEESKLGERSMVFARGASVSSNASNQKKSGSKFIKTKNINDYIFAEVNYHAAYEPQRCIRSKRFKLIKRYPDLRPESPDRLFAAELPRLTNIDESISKTKLLDLGRLQGKTNAEDRFRYAETLLFDLEKDPDELANLAGDPLYADIEQTLSAKLEDWQQETNDELYRTGFITSPQNAIINRQSCVNPDTNDPEDYE